MSTIQTNAIVDASGGNTTTVNGHNITSSNMMGRNLIINGSFVVAQRGTSSTTSGMKTVDRTNLIHSGTDEAPTQAQVDVASGTQPYSLGFRKAFRVTNGNQTSGAGAADYIQYEQGIEAQNVATSGWDSTSTSSNITMSFWIKSSVATTFLGALRATDSTKIYNWDTGALSANTWTKVIKTIPGASGVTVNNDNGLGLQWLLWPYLGTNYTGGGTPNAWKAHDSNDWGASAAATSWYTVNDATCEITGLQIEVGSAATNFEHRSYGEELSLCQRYYQLNITNTGYAMTTTAVRLGLAGNSAMRASPSLSIVSATGVVEDFGTGNRNLVSLGGLSAGAGSGFFLGGAVDATITSTTSSKPHILFPGAIAMSAEV
jgi:hypothetical protein